VRQLYAGEIVEVIDWQKPFVKLADGAGFVEDPDFDGHDTVSNGHQRWAPRVSGTAFRLQGPEPISSSTVRLADLKTETRLPSSARPNPLTMSEKELKSEVCTRGGAGKNGSSTISTVISPSCPIRSWHTPTTACRSMPSTRYTHRTS
jgi:hypothetical protein